MASVPVSFRIPAKRAYLMVLLDALVRLDRIQLRQAPRLPSIYDAGVRYKREGRDPETGSRKEEWRMISQVLAAHSGDCEDLAAWRIAELRQAGINARPWLTRHGGTWHVRVKLPNGTIEDPSKLLGMRGQA